MVQGCRVLVVHPKAECVQALVTELERAGYKVDKFQEWPNEAIRLRWESWGMIFASVDDFEDEILATLENSVSRLKSELTWVLTTRARDPQVIQRVCCQGNVHVLRLPCDTQSVASALRQIELRKKNPLNEIPEMVQAISGVQLGPEKQSLVETAVLRRARQLGLEGVSAYLKFFEQNREAEVKELIGRVTTHTTDFFREADHFEILVTKYLPRIWKENRAGIRIWSAACSTGEEAYTLAMVVLEWLRSNGVDDVESKKIEFIGSDIDLSSLRFAKNGVYPKNRVTRIPYDYLRKYFEEGVGRFAGYMRAGDRLHGMIRWEQRNLLSESDFLESCDVVFLRNVLIYFNQKDVCEIVTRMERVLKPNGVLFLGHSESLNGLDTSFELVGNSIYQRKTNSEGPVVGSAALDLVKVFIVDDSLTIRKWLKRVFSRECGFEVVGEAENSVKLIDKVNQCKPDVLTLDIQMPELDGISFLEAYGSQIGIPVVIISSASYDDSKGLIMNLERGTVVDYIEKPKSISLEDEADDIRRIVRSAKSARKNVRTHVSRSSIAYVSPRDRKSLVAIGASTGGVEALKTVLEAFPPNSPPVMIVQHMPEHFSAAFANRLNQICSVRVKEAEHGEAVVSGRAYIAPGGKQMKLTRSGNDLYIEVNDSVPVNRHKPSVDYLFDSVCEVSSDHEVVGVLLTGMGSDGARGLKKLRDLGAHTIAQDEKSSVVFGMPKEAIALGGAVEVRSLGEIARHIFLALTATTKKSA